MSSENLMRLSGLAALVGGALLVVFDLLNVVLFPGQHGVDMITTNSWFIVQILGPIALILITIGLVGLYTNQAQQAGILGLVAYLLAFSGNMMAFGLLWSEPFLGPMLAAEAPEVFEIEPSGVSAAGFIFTLLLFALGWFLFGFASMRAKVLPRGAAVILMIGAVLAFALNLLELPLWSAVLGVAVAWMGNALQAYANTLAEPELTSKAAM
jgi:hypothetical protein